MTPFDHLGLGPDADEPAIKRAYARRLKQVRPDEDPAGFQCLHEAYQECLTYVRIGAQWYAEDLEPPEEATSTSDDAPGLTPPPSADIESVPDSEPFSYTESFSNTGSFADTEPFPDAELPPTHDDFGVPVHFDTQSFCDSLYSRAFRGRDTALEWLRANEDLYSLELKDALAWPVLEHLGGRFPLPPDTLNAVLGFFDLDTVGRHHYLQDHVDKLHRQSAGAHGNYEHISAPEAEGETPWFTIVWMGLLLMFALARVVSFM